MKKLRRFFESRVKKIPIESDAPRNEYYENVSVRFGIAQVVLFLLLFSFVILSFLANTELITYKNFYYFFKDLNASAEAVDIFESDSVSYPTDNDQSFALYRKGLAVAGNSSVTVFSATGRQILSVPISYRNPVAVGAGKYLLVYEAGGTQYSLYNSDVQIHSGKTEYPINGGTVSDSGMLALITASKEYTSVVSLYRGDFSLLADYNFKDKYVMDVSINSRGNRMGILCSTTQEGAFRTTFQLSEITRDSVKKIAEPVVADSLGLSCSFTSSGKIAILCADSVVYLTDSGKEAREAYKLDGLSVAHADVGLNGIALSAKTGTVAGESRVLVFDKDGGVSYDATVSDKIGQIVFGERVVYWKTSDGVRRLNLLSKALQFTACVTDDRVLLAVSDDEVLFCSPQKATYVGFD